MKEKNNPQRKKGRFRYFLLWGIFWEFLHILKKKEKIGQIENNFKEYLKEEEKEIEKYAKGCESLPKFFCNSGSLFRDFFIPSHANSHKPKILRTKSLTLIVIIMALLKLSVALYVFYFMAYQAKMSENMTAQILELVNRDRVAQGLSVLNSNAVLSASALSKAENMVLNNYFAHYSPDGRKPWDFIDRNAYPYLFVGENLAMNFTSAESAHQALMLSPSHKENILNERYRDIGLAIVNGQIAGKNTNVLVQLFALKKEAQVNLALTVDKSAGSTEPAINLPKTEPKKAPETISAPKSETIASARQEVISAQPKAQVISAPEKTAVASLETKVENVPVIAQAEIEKIANAVPALPDANKIADKEIPLPVEAENAPAPEAAPAKEAIGRPSLAGEQVLSEAEIAQKPLFIEAELSPNSALEKNALTEVKSFDNIPDRDMISGDRRMKMLNGIMLAILGGLFLILMGNIIIKAEVQHKPVIFQALLALVCLAGLIYLNFNFLENVLPKLFIV